MIKTVFLVPVRDNDGQPFSRVLWRELGERLESDFGGFSRRDGVRGQWQGYRDVSREFTVALDSWRPLPGWLALIA